LQTPEDKVAFLKRFWQILDFTPATFVNERLIEHYTRLVYARQHFSWIDMRGYDDRGEIYIRYGPPDDRVENVIESASVPVSSWVYHRLNRPVHFDFINEGYGFSLTGRLIDAIRTFNPVSELLAFRDLVIQRINLHPDYMYLYFKIEGMMRNLESSPVSSLHSLSSIRGKVERHVGEFEVKSVLNQARVPHITTDILLDMKDLPCALNLALFEGREQQTDLVAAYGFRMEDIKSKADTARFACIGSIRDTTLKVVTSQTHEFEIDMKSTHELDELVSVFSQSLPADKYYFFLDATNRSGNQRGLRDFSVTLSNYPEGMLHLSSAIFAKDVLPAIPAQNQSSFQRHHLSITPYPFPTINRNAPIFIYFEIYDLKRDATGETLYEVEYEVQAPKKGGLASLLASLNPFGNTGSSISVSEVRRGTSTVEPTYLQWDFSSLRNGKYDLIIRVTDQIAHLTEERKLGFELKN
jgi:GWxTD domain-containing protein